eukprot:5399195-Prymnesium_polylepis.1
MLCIVAPAALAASKAPALLKDAPQLQGFFDYRCPAHYHFCLDGERSFCDADANCKGDDDCAGSEACPSSTDTGKACCTTEVLTGCPPFYPFCDHTAAAPSEVAVEFEATAHG